MSLYESYLDSLVIWAQEKNYHVEFEKKGDDSICHISRIIEINSSNSLKTQVIRLLHECGHVLIFENGSTEGFENLRQRFQEENREYKVYRVLEEAEAWKRSRNLAKRLGIQVSEKEFEDEMLSALHKYMRWAARS